MMLHNNLFSVPKLACNRFLQRPIFIPAIFTESENRNEPKHSILGLILEITFINEIVSSKQQNMHVKTVIERETAARACKR